MANDRDGMKNTKIVGCIAVIIIYLTSSSIVSPSNLNFIESWLLFNKLEDGMSEEFAIYSIASWGVLLIGLGLLGLISNLDPEHLKGIGTSYIILGVLKSGMESFFIYAMFNDSYEIDWISVGAFVVASLMLIGTIKEIRAQEAIHHG